MDTTIRTGDRGTTVGDRDFESAPGVDVGPTGNHRTGAVDEVGRPQGESALWGEALDADRPRGVREERLGRALGWFSIGLGLAEVAAPEKVARFAGASRKHAHVVRLLGLREIATGFGILAQKRPTAGTWARVGGDMVDLAFLGAAFGTRRSNKTRLALSTGAILGIAALDALAAQQLSATPSDTTEEGALRVRKSLVIGRSPSEIYRFWRQLETLPLFMPHLESVQETGDDRSHWVARGPAGKRVEWNAEITEDVPDRRIAWRALGGSDVYHTGSVRFEPAPGDRGTIVHVEIEYRPPGGFLGAGVAKLFGQEPGQQIEGDLRRLRQFLETGEIVRSEATIEGVGTFDQQPGRAQGDGAAPEGR